MFVGCAYRYLEWHEANLPEDMCIIGSGGFGHFDDLNEAMEAALREIGPAADVIVMPHGGSVLPVVSG